MMQHYGIDPPKDLKSLTRFESDYCEYTGTAIIQAEYDVGKIEARLAKAMNYRKTRWNDHSTIEMSKCAKATNNKAGKSKHRSTSSSWRRRLKVCPMHSLNNWPSQGD